MMSMTMLMSAMISSILMALMVKLMEKSMKKLEKKSSFECGFNPMTMKKTAFTTNFLLLAMIFLIFDVEISILIPISIMNKNYQISMMTLMMCLIVTLILMTMKEWKQGSMEWTK